MIKEILKLFKPKSHIQIRYNTKTDGKLPWRIIIDGKESLASFVEVEGYCYAESSVVNGETKFNIACYGRVEWSGTKARIYNTINFKRIVAS